MAINVRACPRQRASLSSLSWRFFAADDYAFVHRLALMVRGCCTFISCLGAFNHTTARREARVGVGRISIHLSRAGKQAHVTYINRVYVLLQACTSYFVDEKLFVVNHIDCYDSSGTD